LEQFVDIRSDRRDAFRSIAFTPQLERARRLADDVPLPSGAVALHLRAGDIVYGRFRASGVHHDKVVSYPIGLEILNNARENGKSVVIFGQDHTISGYMREKYGAIIANDICNDFSLGDVERALFDIALMARCDQIIAGHSAFSVTAAKIAGIEVSAPQAILAPGQAKAVILRALRDSRSDVPASPPQKAMAAWHAVMAAGYDLADPACRELVSESIRNDPKNPYYLAVAAIGHYLDNEIKLGEEVLLSALSGPHICSELVSHMMDWIHYAPVLSAPPNRALLEKISAEGWPAASLFLSLIAQSSKKEEEKKKYWGQYIANKTPEMPSDFSHVFQSKAR
jgi:hypothetical protein